MLTYNETIDYLFNRYAAFQRVGASAYKPGLENTERLDAICAHPHQKYRIIHVAGTNGKGSTSHLLAAILQSAGFKVGLYTSPHLADFRERIRVNGEMIPKEEVVKFVTHYSPLFEPVNPSFFEYTMMMAFDWFARQQVDFAVVEVGLGGRLDSTNIVQPILSVITNIGFDHMQFLGNTLDAIASEKAGIMKRGIPCVVGETDDVVHHVMKSKGQEVECPITWAEETDVTLWEHTPEGGAQFCMDGKQWFTSLGGDYQRANVRTVWCALTQLRQMGIEITDSATHEGFAHVKELTGLRGRWEVTTDKARGVTTIADTGHNEHGLRRVMNQLLHTPHRQIRLVVGMVNDKDVAKIIALFPRQGIYYFTQPSVERRLPVEQLAATAHEIGLTGNLFHSVSEAYEAALNESEAGDIIYVGGSSFVVADYQSIHI